MSRNIKEIGKELMGKSLNSFHRKVGLTQLEENNKMQDGILDGILSQVDDAYIEKTEQSNVIHLDGSGDGVVVVDSIEGNTMVNMLGLPTSTTNSHVGTYNIRKNGFTITFNTQVGNKANIYFSNSLIEVNKGYTLFMNITKNTLIKENANTSSYNVTKFNFVSYNKGVYTIKNGETGMVRVYLQQPATTTHNGIPYLECYDDCAGELVVENAFMIEGDWTNREIPSYFEGLQSSFEEQVEDNKYKIEILSQSENIFNVNSVNSNHIVQPNGKLSSNSAWVLYDYEPIAPLQNIVISEKYVNGRYFQYRMCYYDKDKNFISAKDLTGYDGYKTDITPSNAKYFRLNHSIAVNGNSVNREEIMVSYGTTYRKKYVPYKHNKIKLLINEPLRGIGNVKDKLCIKDNKLMVKRFYKEVILNGTENWSTWSNQNNETTLAFYCQRDMQQLANLSGIMCDNFIVQDVAGKTIDCIDAVKTHYLPRLRISKSKLNTQDINGLKQWLQNNPTKLVFQTIEPYYEEVTNEYGEPIILEGYENGTLYIDSTIVPTTTVRYTPKMESFKTLNEVSDNNTMLANDINDNIIPYMMDVDFMIMEKEMALPSQINIRKMEALDMASMQKRTQDMLERLIKGKTLTEQECKTRITTYLNAGKITDAQAEELNFLIDEIYA